MNDDDELLERLGDAIDPPVPPVDPDRLAGLRAAARVAAGASAPGVDVEPASARPSTPEPADAPSVVPFRSRRALLRTAAAAVGGVAAGAFGAFLVVDDDPAPAGPPTEVASLRASDGVVASARMIDHTWGLEVLLDVDGLQPGAAYEMTFVAADGRRVPAGGFVGTGKLMRCRNNGALLRADTAGFVVTGPDGEETLAAELA